MIIHSFDPDSQAIISPRDFYGEARQLCDVCIITFSHVIFSHVLESFPHEQAAEIHACNGITPIYLLTVNGRKIGFYMTHVGAAGAGTDVIECHHMTGATKFVMFGSAGNLNKEATAGKYVVPSEAYRDEGMSYHYAPPAAFSLAFGTSRRGCERGVQGAALPLPAGRCFLRYCSGRGWRSLLRFLLHCAGNSDRRHIVKQHTGK